MALALAPDGNGRLFLNQQEVARLPVPMYTQPGQKWYLLFQGRGVDAQFLIRDLVLWEGMRY